MQLDPAGAKLAIISLLVFAITGIGLSSLIEPHVSNTWLINSLPIVVSSLLLIYVVMQKQGLEIKKASIIYLLAVSSVVASLYLLDQKYAPLRGWFPFQANKLGCLVTAILCPSFAMGILGILLHAGSSVVNFVNFPAEVQSAIAFPEPIGIIAFGLAAVILLFFRFRRIQLQHEIVHAQHEARTLKELAKSSVRLRDLMNTPIQNIEIAAWLLRQSKTGNPKIQDSLDNAVANLKGISKSLKAYDAMIDWSDESNDMQ